LSGSHKHGLSEDTGGTVTTIRIITICTAGA
jgi:hypothetical protein